MWPEHEEVFAPDRFGRVDQARAERGQYQPRTRTTGAADAVMVAGRRQGLSCDGSGAPGTTGLLRCWMFAGHQAKPRKFDAPPCRGRSWPHRRIEPHRKHSGLHGCPPDALRSKPSGPAALAQNRPTRPTPPPRGHAKAGSAFGGGHAPVASCRAAEHLGCCSPGNPARR